MNNYFETARIPVLGVNDNSQIIGILVIILGIAIITCVVCFYMYFRKRR